MLYFTAPEELRIFMWSILLGVFFGAVYDLFRCIRAGFPEVHIKPLVFVEDLAYMIFCSVCYFIFVMQAAGGSARAYILVGALAGFAAEHLTFGRILLKIVRAAVNFTRKYILKPIFSILIRPFSIIFRKIVTKIKNIFCAKLQNNKKNKKSRKNHLQDRGKLLYNNNQSPDTSEKGRQITKGSTAMAGETGQADVVKVRKKPRKHKKAMINYIFFVVVALLLLYAVRTIVVNQAQISQQEADIQKIKDEITAAQQENDEYMRVLDSDNEEEYMERMAIERLGYGYANEKRFYVMSGN